MATFNLMVRVVVTLALVLACSGARADTPIRLLKSFAGNVNFVGIQQTLRNKGNNKPCEVYDPGSERSAKLPAIPSTATILSAHLYWAGSGSTADYSVIFDDVTITAPSDRRYSSATIGNGFDYFSGAADVTAQVKANYADKKKNQKYTFRGLAVSTGSPHCASEAVLGGFALLVIYQDASESLRLLNLYEGFQFMRYTGITLNLSGFRVPNPIGTATGRVGHITWEGDSTLEGIGENLKFNDVELTDNQNPAGNQFNSRSNIDGDPKSYGIDFDAYTLTSPVIKGGQTTASTRYESGQDLVLLGAEIVAMPNVPMADLSLAMQLNNTMALGQNATFTLVASNKGPSPETGPTVVMTTLSPGLTYTSMSGGSSWACAPAGQVVTCKYTGSIAAGASLPPLTLNAKVTATGKLTVSATVSGAMYDPDLGNNTAIIERTISEGATYFFTDKACNLNVVVDTPGECSTTLAPIVAGEARDIYVTHVADGKTVAPGTAIQAMTFALRCLNPETNAGIKASYAGQVLPVCAENDTVPAAWSSLSNITFVGASSKLSFKYLDVGKVQLLLRLGATGKVGESSAFVSIPHEVRIFAIKGNTGVAAPVNPQDADLFTIAAGVEFSVSAGAFSKDGTLTPNFGRELIDGAGFAVPAVSIGASTSAGIAAMTHDEDNAHDEVAYVLPALRGSFPSPQGGASTGLFMWDDVGIINLTPGIASMTYHGVNLSPTLLITPQKAGRFIPHHFKTETTQRMLCTPKMTCPPGVGAAYSRENFDVTVTARSKSGAQTMNYRGAFAREVVLSAWSKAGASLAAEQKSGLSKTSAKASDFNDGVATVAPSYTLLNPFVHTSPQGPWGAPESIFLRAVEAGGGVTSNVEDPLEAGIRIVNGRLFVPSAHGSERLNLPLQLSAQYWSGSNWEVSSNDKHTLIDPDPAKVAFTKLVGLSNTTLSLLPSTAQLLTLGVAKYAVKAPGQTGTAELLMDQMIWLPSTKGRIKFGTYKSPLIYLRELH